MENVEQKHLQFANRTIRKAVRVVEASPELVSSYSTARRQIHFFHFSTAVGLHPSGLNGEEEKNTGTWPGQAGPRHLLKASTCLLGVGETL